MNSYKFILALIIGYVGWKFINILVTKTINIMKHEKVEKTVCSFVESFLRIFLKLIFIICLMDFVGISTKSITAFLASAGLAVGLALKSSLSNLAGGIIILLMKPFKVGDYIETSNHNGQVKKINIFYTYLINKDNKEVLIPNGLLVNSSFEKKGLIK